MTAIMLPEHLGEFAVSRGHRYEFGVGAFNALFNNRQKLGVFGEEVVGRPLIYEESFMNWKIDRYHLTVRRNVWDQYPRIGKKTVELLVDYQLEILRRKHRALLRDAG